MGTGQRQPGGLLQLGSPAPCKGVLGGGGCSTSTPMPDWPSPGAATTCTPRCRWGMAPTPCSLLNTAVALAVPREPETSPPRYQHTTWWHLRSPCSWRSSAWHWQALVLPFPWGLAPASPFPACAQVTQLSPYRTEPGRSEPVNVGLSNTARRDTGPMALRLAVGTATGCLGGPRIPRRLQGWGWGQTQAAAGQGSRVPSLRCPLARERVPTGQRWVPGTGNPTQTSSIRSPGPSAAPSPPNHSDTPSSLHASTFWHCRCHPQPNASPGAASTDPHLHQGAPTPQAQRRH